MFLFHLEMPRLPSEWDSWLRHRRADPPTEEEIARNTVAAEMRAIKGREFEVSILSFTIFIPWSDGVSSINDLFQGCHMFAL